MSVTDSCILCCHHHLLPQVTSRTMNSGWPTPQTKEARRETAASWASKRRTGGWRNNRCAGTGRASWWARSKAPACAPETTTYGASPSFYQRLSLCWSMSVKPWPFPSPTATTATILMWTARSVWGNPAPTKPWSPVWRARRTSCSQRGNNSRSFFRYANTPPVDTHTLLTASAGTGRLPATGARAGSVLSWPCRLSSGPAAWIPAPLRLPGPCLQSQTLTHRWAHLSRTFNRWRLDFSFINAGSACFPAREAGADPGVCGGWRRRPDSRHFRHLCRQEGGVQEQVSRTHVHSCTHLTHTPATDLCGVTSPSAGHQCTDSPTCGSRMMRMASHQNSKAPPAATARPANRTQMTWDTFTTISLFLSCFELIKTSTWCDFRTITDTFPPFFFLQDLIEWHMTRSNGCDKDSWLEAAWKKTLLDLSLMFGPQHHRGSERQAWKFINLLSWLLFHCFASLLCVQYFFFFCNYYYCSFTLCCSTFFYFLSNVKTNETNPENVHF